MKKATKEVFPVLTHQAFSPNREQGLVCRKYAGDLSLKQLFKNIIKSPV